MPTTISTALAITAFAANSVLCRMALQSGAIDAASFSTVRFAAGALVLTAIVALTRRHAALSSGDWMTAGALFLYGIPFSFAYVRLTAGTGALILFGAVQLTMMVSALAYGERPRRSGWVGLMTALIGLIYLISPGLAAPPLSGAVLMATAGVAWGVYSLRGRGAPDPLAQTTSHFVRCLPLVVAVSVITWPPHQVQMRGVVLAATSGAVTSGGGYVIWYHALRRLTAAQAAVVQLAVPVVAAAGGVLFLDERLSMRLIVASVLVLGGIALTLTALWRRP